MSGLLDRTTCEELMSEHLSSGKSIRDLIIDGSYVTEDDLLNEMANYHSLEVATLQGIDIMLFEYLRNTIARLRLQNAVDGGGSLSVVETNYSCICK